MERRRAKRLSEAEVGRLIGVTTGERLERRDRAMLEVFYGSGIRVSELCGLDVEDLDLDAPTANVLGKGNKRRTVPLTPPAVVALRTYLQWRKTHGAQNVANAARQGSGRGRPGRRR